MEHLVLMWGVFHQSWGGISCLSLEPQRHFERLIMGCRSSNRGCDLCMHGGRTGHVTTVCHTRVGLDGYRAQRRSLPPTRDQFVLSGRGVEGAGKRSGRHARRVLTVGVTGAVVSPNCL